MFRPRKIQKHYTPFLLLLALLAAAFQVGCGSGVAEVPDTSQAPNELYTININTAAEDELQQLPHIGPKLAERIVTYREANGRFERIEELMMVDGVSDSRFRNMRHMISVE